MAKIERFIVSHHSGCEICEPKIFNTAGECIDYIMHKLAECVTEHVDKWLDKNSDDYKEYISLETDAEKFNWGQDYSLIKGYSFIETPDWEEYDYSSVEIEVSDDEYFKELKRDRKISQTEAKVFRTTMIGKKYRHFKGNIYVVDNIAVHSETGELRVIYHSDDNPENVWDRNLEMFLSPVDKNKYPDVKQELRFEPIN